ncbi:MAG: esterase [Lachnospiraceae bacterium]|nr:esterase [Lachnospiraceae bacterium]
MRTEYFKSFSTFLNRDMEIKVYGHAGVPFLFIPCQDGRFYDFENYRMTDVWAPFIDAGQVMVFAVDTTDKETWSDGYGGAGHRSWLYEQWVNYLCEEVVPFARAMSREFNEWDELPMVGVFGASLGATHAVNLYFKRPDLFDRLLALSGVYSSEYGFGGYMDDRLYFNSPIHYLSNLPEDHPFIEQYNQKKAVICTGQGPWEVPQFTRQLDEILHRKGIRVWVDYWGYDSAHDWPWWYKQVSYFLPYLLEEDDEAEPEG